MRIARVVSLTFCLVCTALPLFAEEITASDLLERSIAYHDPDGQWPTFSGKLIFKETRPDGTWRDSQVTIDLPGQRFVHEMKTAESHVVRKVDGEVCSGLLDGSTEFSSEQATENRLTCDQIKRYRDYYTFLWGLPMKLRDPGTRLDPEVTTTRFMDDDALAIRVTYDPEVGGDTWYFYFDPTSHALVGYRFYHDESKNDGEYITLKGEYELDRLRIPRERTWYVNADDRLLGTDRLESHE